MTERDFFTQKLKALSWLKEFRNQEHPQFTFRFAIRRPSDLFQGERNKNYFYVEIAERAGDNGRFYFNFEFKLSEENGTIKQVKLQLRWADDNGGTNPVYLQFAQQAFPDIGDKKSKYKTFEGNTEDEVRNGFINWLTENYQAIVDVLGNAILSENDFNTKLNNEVQLLVNSGIINADEVNGVYQLTDTAFQDAIPEVAPEGAGGNEHAEIGITMQEEIKRLLKSNAQVILTGAPGTGKTFTARQVAEELVCEGVEGDEDRKAAIRDRVQSVQFHPGYDYSDFVIGLKPVVLDAEGNEVAGVQDGNVAGNGNVHVSFRWKDGMFKAFANKAKGDLAHNYVFLIDEINRADLSRVFGELFSLLEEEYRYFIDADGKPHNEKGITLPDGKTFVIPKNLYIIGTMNDIDRSVESMDFALRRRFAWKEIKAEESSCIIEKKINDEGVRKRLKTAMRDINEKIVEPNLRLGTEFQLGGAIFAKYIKYADCANAFECLWDNHIKTILNEYLRGRRDKEERLKELNNVYNKAIQAIDGGAEPLQA